MNWPRITGLALALSLHAGVMALIFVRSNPDALASGSGSDNLTVVATVSLESGDLFTQSAQQASADAVASKAAPKIVRPANAEAETSLPDTSAVQQQTRDEAPKQPEAIPENKDPELPPPEKQKNVTQMTSVASEAQDAQQAAAAQAARQSKLWSLYQTEIYSSLERHKVHIAKTGDVLLQMTIDPSGKLLTRAVLKSSGSAELDKAAIAALERSAPFPPVPPEVSSVPLTLAVPFHFRTR
jgi:periplasmic protein TonB